MDFQYQSKLGICAATHFLMCSVVAFYGVQNYYLYWEPNYCLSKIMRDSKTRNSIGFGFVS
jgi:hypothetical protein